MSVYERLKALSISLPGVAAPAAAYVPFVRSGRYLYLSGHIAKKGGQPWRGRLGADMPTEEGAQAARAVAIDLLGTLHAAVGDLDKISRIIKLTVMVSSDSGYCEQHLVANGASELLKSVFGEPGAHARSAIGVAQLPLGACVEIELIAESGD